MTTLIILGIIAWCVIGYFVNIKMLKRIGEIVPNDIICSIICSFNFPVGCLCSFYLYPPQKSLLQTIADWHNK